MAKQKYKALRRGQVNGLPRIREGDVFAHDFGDMKPKWCVPLKQYEADAAKAQAEKEAEAQTLKDAKKTEAKKTEAKKRAPAKKGPAAGADAQGRPGTVTKADSIKDVAIK